MKQPGDCKNMAELRTAIDALDSEIMQLLAMRVRYIDRAAQLKPGEGMPARITSRVEQVVANARSNAAAGGLDADLAESIWRSLIEWSIAREEGVLGR